MLDRIPGPPLNSTSSLTIQTLLVLSATTLNGSVVMSSTLNISGLITGTAGLSISSSTTLSGSVSIGGTLSCVSGAAQFAALTASAVSCATLSVSSATTLTGLVTMSAGLTVASAATFAASVVMSSTLNISGIITSTNTTSATTSLLGAVVIGNGTAATSIGMGAGNINAGGTLTVGGTITTTNGVITSNTTAGNNIFTVNAPTGSSPALLLKINNVSQTEWLANSTNAMIGFDSVNSTNFFLYTAGAINASIVNFPGTLAASSNSTGAVTVTGGIGVTGNSYIGGTVNVGTSLTAGTTIATTNGSITATTTAGQCFLTANGFTNAGLILNAATGSTCSMYMRVNGVNQYIIGQSTTQWFLQDAVASTFPLTYNQGAIGACFLTFAGTLSASSSTAGAVVIGNGTAATSVAFGAGNAQIGTALTVGVSASSVGAINVNSSGNAIATLNAATGSTARCRFQVNSTTQYDWSASGSALSLLDSVNGTTPFSYNAGTLAACVFVFAGTLDATTNANGAYRFAGGASFTKNLIAGQGLGWGVTSTATAAGTTVLTSSTKVIQVFTGTTTQAVTLPAANVFGAGVSYVLRIKNVSTGTVTINRAGADTIDGGTSTTLTGGSNQSVDLVSDGVSAWYIT